MKLRLIIYFTLIQISFIKAQQTFIPANPGFGQNYGSSTNGGRIAGDNSDNVLVDFSNAAIQSGNTFSWPSPQTDSNPNGRVASTSSATSTSSNKWLIAEPPLIVQPSPTAAGIVNQSKESVDLYTGKINISLPIYTLNSREISIPIELSYSTSGVRIEDIASWVGMSWSLNAGGCISRVMKGLPDEFIGTVRPLTYAVPTGTGLDAFGFLNIKDRDGLNGVLLNNFNTYSDTKRKKIIRNSDWMSLDGQDFGDGLGFGEAWDTEPDVFSFNFGKYSGQFVFDQNGDIKFLTNQNFKITKEIGLVNGETIPKILSFTIYAEDGTKYTFGDSQLLSVERTQNFSVRRTVKYVYPAKCNDGDGLCRYRANDGLYGSYIWSRLPVVNLRFDGANTVVDITDSKSIFNFFTSTWYLREIESATGDKITLNYEKPQYALGYVQSQDERVKMPNLSEIELFDYSKSPAESMGWYFISPAGDNTFSSQEVTFSRNEVVIDHRRLSSIVSSTGSRVEFIPQSTTRRDLLGDQALEYIKIYNNDNEKIKSYKLEYEYHEPTSYTGNIKYYVDSINHVLMGFYEYDDNAYLERIYAEQRRMFLSKVFELGANENSDNPIPPYEFVYDNQVLPRSTGFKKDKWGFFNGNKNGSQIPHISYTGLLNDYVPRSGLPLMKWFINWAEKPSWLGADITPNEALAQAGILKKMYFPQGGYKEFTYELNKAGSENVGGLRIKNIKSYTDENASTPLIENYSYSGGVEVHKGLYLYSILNNRYGGMDIFASSDPITPTYLTHGGTVGYRTVKKFNGGLGKTTYTFKTPNEIVNDASPIYQVGKIGTAFNIYPFPQDTDNDWKRGLLEETKVTLEDESKILNQVINTYNLAPSNFTSEYVYGFTPGIYNYDGYDFYRGGLYKYQVGWQYLQTQISKEFNSQYPGDVNKALINTTQYEYDVKSFLGHQYTFLKSQTINSAERVSFKTEYRYPLDIDNYSSSLPVDPVGKALLKMSRVKHMLANPIETIKYRNGEVVESTVFTYKGFPDDSDKIRQYQGFLLEIDKPITNYTKFNIISNTPDIIVKDSRCINKYTIVQYDNVGNILQYVSSDGIPVTILYGYNQTYPVAEIKNATYLNVVTALGQSLIDQLKTNPDMIDLVNPILKGSSYTQNCFVTTYKYKPLVGIVSVTNPNGLTTHYEYDSFNRLKYIKDFKLDLINAYDYNYMKR